MNETNFAGSFPTARFGLPQALPEIAFAGRSNVGKSSLLNALAGRQALARTSQTPGQTRACNVFVVGERFYLVDLPGYGWARASKARRRALGRLIQDYVVHRPVAGLVWLLDLRRDPSADDLAFRDLLAERSTRVLVALTKTDRVPRRRRPERVEAILRTLGTDLTREQCVLTSARTREGIDELRQAIGRLVGGWAGGRMEGDVIPCR